MSIQAVKKIGSLALAGVLTFSLFGCASPEESVSDEPVSILCPTGAPALSILGASDLEDVTIEYVDGTDILTSELAKEDGEYDIILAPTNLGAKVYAQSEAYQLDAVMTWGNLYLVGQEGVDLSTATIAAFGQNAVPGLVFNTVEFCIRIATSFIDKPSTSCAVGSAGSSGYDCQGKGKRKYIDDLTRSPIFVAREYRK